MVWVVLWGCLIFLVCIVFYYVCSGIMVVFDELFVFGELVMLLIDCVGWWLDI